MDASRHLRKYFELDGEINMESRSVILFMDNATVDPVSLIEKESNIKIVCFPKNTTSRLQPLDADIIKNFKLKYRKKLMCYMLIQIADVYEIANVYEIAKEIDVIQAIEWVASGWKEISGKILLIIVLQNVALWCTVLTPMTTKMLMNNLTISLKNYFRRCKSMVTSLLMNTLILITRFPHHFHPQIRMRFTGDVFPRLPASRNMVLLMTSQSKLKATTTVMRITTMKVMYLRLASKKP